MQFELSARCLFHSRAAFTFQQDRALSHWVHETAEYFVSKCTLLSPHCGMAPNSPDLNPVDHEDWGVLRRWVYHTMTISVDHIFFSSILSKSGITLATESSDEMFNIGTFDCVHVFLKTLVTLSTFCELLFYSVNSSFMVQMCELLCLRNYVRKIVEISIIYVSVIFYLLWWKGQLIMLCYVWVTPVSILVSRHLGHNVCMLNYNTPLCSVTLLINKLFYYMFLILFRFKSMEF